ncbi:MAG: hypothetical protein ACYSW3_09155 [Planctomycetota bacterium]
MSNKTYTELSDNLQAWLEDDDAEFVGSIDDVINLGEMRLWRDLDLSIFTSEDTISTSVGAESVTKPVTDTELVATQSIYYDTVANERIWLELRSTDFVRDHQVIGATAPPKYYAEQTETDWLLSPIPDAIYTLNARGVTRPTRLSAGNTTTWLSLHQDDMLFKACLAEAEAFLKADDRAPMWMEQYTAELPMAKRETYELLNQRYNMTPLEAPAVPTNQR